MFSIQIQTAFTNIFYKSKNLLNFPHACQKVNTYGIFKIRAFKGVLQSNQTERISSKNIIVANVGWR